MVEVDETFRLWPARAAGGVGEGPADRVKAAGSGEGGGMAGRVRRGEGGAWDMFFLDRGWRVVARS